MDMEHDIFAEQPYGAEAIKKMGPVPENFRLYLAGWIDKGRFMEVVGAEFQRAKSGKNKGKLSVLVKGTNRRVVLSAEEVKQAGQKAAAAAAVKH